MNYELCKKLEEAGFPVGVGETIHDHTVDPSVHYYEPTLSELIEACGDGFQSLLRVKDYPGWYAYKTGFGGKNETEFEGTTKEIAVAHLYLAINKKTV